jgi:hypothetical protein
VVESPNSRPTDSSSKAQQRCIGGMLRGLAVNNRRASRRQAASKNDAADKSHVVLIYNSDKRFDLHDRGQP